MSKGTHNLYYQKRIEQAINKSLSEFKRLSIFRIDLRSPYGRIDYKDDHKVNTRFFESLKRRIMVDVKNKSHLWGRNLRVNVDYVWVREVGPINQKTHYHVALLLNKDVYYSTGHYHEGNNLAALIINAWDSALGLFNNPQKGLVQFSSCHYLEQEKIGFEQAYINTMHALSYLAKDYSKPYHDRFRCFGGSQ
ncbi:MULTISPECIES: inovirus Gp2 family protein [Providencia]|uniref:YagK/YfjJ C-terminal domain-containing protein n=1 Tax=Providencia heimbachae ATCC 35613 TaxID=1354272 RepID=A0A1B7JXN6_9GAMM|nr:MULTISPECIES: inovirus Gp2 family protein [Providencia]OAT52683.1 hypothetical protein M998_1545 [Providencia heimbachae ATCC 35613]SQH14850.1 Protein of uncharacterised function (DUF3296) [Providencia heimbachae]